MERTLRRLILIGCSLALAACSGGSSDSGSPQPAPAAPTAAQPASPTPAPVAITKPEAFSFLNQATFGATETDAAQLIAMGYDGWLANQLAQPVSLELPHLRSLPRPLNLQDLQRDRVDIWFRNALHGPDQLRQRVAFALTEIMVVSQVGALAQAPYSLASYYDLLATNAFGNFRDLMEAVTLHPAMGQYLSMLGNQKPNASGTIRPDENYARELMQLFTIGLVELNLDGTPRLTPDGQPIPTYSQAIIQGFAHVYTGWSFAGSTNFLAARRTDANQVVPMQLYPNYHDTGPKLVLGGQTLPADQTGQKDLDDALDIIFSHPNVAPFVAQRLIQRLVTSNPSPQYVERVAARFNDNGAGVRGDLAAVIKAILLDAEARPATPTDRNGKLKEPLLRLTQFWRAYGARSTAGGYIVNANNNVGGTFGQGPLQAASVFNFFSPFFAPPGEIRDAGLVAPELELATEYLNTVFTNFMVQQCFSRNSRSTNVRAEDVVIQIDDEVGLAASTDALIERVNQKLLGGTMSATLRTEIAGIVNRVAATDAVTKAAEAVYYTVTSPEFAAQR
jgi:uncharacterized protein (DUF1800 family)